MAYLIAVRDYFAGFVHPSALRDAVTAELHRTFILSHMMGGVLALAALPFLLLAHQGTPAPSEMAALVWLVLPVLAALDLSRHGNLERAHFISVTALAGLVFSVAAMTGGIGSFALIWLPVVAFEAAFSGSRRVVLASLGVVALVIISLVGLGTAGLLQAGVATPSFLPELSAFAAVIYTAGLALRWDAIQKKRTEVHASGEARYQMLAGSVSELVTHHSASGAVCFASPGSDKVLGVSTNELHGRGFFERVHVADRPIYLKALSDAARGEETHVQFRMRKPDPEAALHSTAPRFIHVDMRCRPTVENATGQRQVIAVTRELEDKSVRKTSDAMREEADVAQDVKRHFLASMSHELRTPLNAIIGFSELLSSGDFARDDDARRQEYAGLIHESGLHLLAVVNSLLDMSRIDSGHFSIVSEPFTMKPVVESCVQLFRLKAEQASVDLICDVDGDMPDTLADKRACKQILINLISNAIKFTPENGEVRVSFRAEDDAVCINVEDTGIGISSDDLPKLGTPFFQARSSYDRPYEGTGLGLSVVRGLVALHGGTFDIHSNVGSGTRVSIRLPRYKGSVVRNEPQKEAIAPHLERRAAIG